MAQSIGKVSQIIGPVFYALINFLILINSTF
jgi:rRNA processing protein Gar1